MARIVGITGSIATGKSTVLRMFAELGADTLSADDVAREVLASGSPASNEVVGAFGDGILTPDGEIDRPALAELIFSDEDSRRRLDEITHPRIIAIIQAAIDEYRRAHPSPRSVLAIEIPLLFECEMQDTVDEVLLVAAEQETQVSRLTNRTGMARREALRRIASQMPLALKIERADRVVWNDTDVQSLRESVRREWERICLP